MLTILGILNKVKTIEQKKVQVTKLVDLVAMNSEQLILHFSVFSSIY